MALGDFGLKVWSLDGTRVLLDSSTSVGWVCFEVFRIGPGEVPTRAYPTYANRRVHVTVLFERMAIVTRYVQDPTTFESIAGLMPYGSHQAVSTASGYPVITFAPFVNERTVAVWAQ